MSQQNNSGAAGNPSPQDYSELVKQKTPHSHFVRDTWRAFWVGGVVCVIGQLIIACGTDLLNMGKDDAGTLASITLVFIAILLTGIGVFDKIGKYAGGGTIVPITGFANSIAAAAMEFRSEGLVLGVGARMFQIAGPVLVYGITASVIWGVIAYILEVAI